VAAWTYSVAAVTVHHGAEHYRFAEQSVVVNRLRSASGVGVLREGVDAAVLGCQIASLMAGHHLICERSDTTDELPSQVRAMWSTVSPLVATEDWVARHPTCVRA
jgi:hypothetical protein